jgi:LPS-assembly protein
LSFLDKVPVYFSFEGAAEGVSRKESVDNSVQFVGDVGGNPIITPTIVQRLDVHPRFELPLSFAGWNLTASGDGRVTFYSNSLDPKTRDVLSQNITRSYGEFEFDVRPPAFSRDFHRPSGAFYFRHVIEPYMVYRRLAGINNFDQIIRFDYVDAIADTNEIEFGVANRFFTRRSTENVNAAAVNQSPVSSMKRLRSRYVQSISSIRCLVAR